MKLFSNRTDNIPDTAFTDGETRRLMSCAGLRIQELLALTSDGIASNGPLFSITRAVHMTDSIPQFAPLNTKDCTRPHDGFHAFANDLVDAVAVPNEEVSE